MQTPSKQEELEALRAKVEQLEAEVALPTVPQWEISRDYPMYHAAGGFLLGLFGAMISLLFNVVGSLLFGKDPMDLVRVYLTFPLGDKALQLVEGGAATAYAIPDGVIIALGCCLYLATGMLLGIPVCLAIRQFAAQPVGHARVHRRCDGAADLGDQLLRDSHLAATLAVRRPLDHRQQPFAVVGRRRDAYRFRHDCRLALPDGPGPTAGAGRTEPLTHLVPAAVAGCVSTPDARSHRSRP